MITRPEIIGQVRILPSGRKAEAIEATHKCVVYRYGEPPRRREMVTTVSLWRSLPLAPKEEQP